MLFLAIWVIATVSTKYLVKDGTRQFLYQHTVHLAKSWVDILSQQHLSNIKLSNQSSQLLNGWINDELVIQQGPFKLDKPSRSETYIKKVGEINWVISTECANNICALVGFRDLERRYAARRLVASISVPLLLIFFITTVAIYYAIQSGLRPLNALTQKVSESDINKLETVNEEKPTKELSPLVNALNQLIINMNKQLLKERQFLDTCAHELRTPVTALVSQIQSIPKPQQLKPKQLKRIHDSALRTVRVANQFLMLARNSNNQALPDQNNTFDLCESIRQIASELINTDTDVDIQMTGEKHLSINADPLAIEVACKNMIENALRYGKNTEDEKSKIIITCQQEALSTILTVEDNGSGVHSDHREKLLKRFYRIPGKNSEGAGLGLSIVSEIAERYNGNVTISESEQLGGFKITVSFSGIVNKS